MSRGQTPEPADGGRGRAGGRANVPAPRSGSPKPVAPRYPIGTRARWASYFALAVLGIAVALAGALVVDLWSGGGLVLGAVGILALSYGGSVLTGTKTGAAVPTLTWLGTLLAASIGTPEGDLLWGGSATSVALLFLGLLGSVLSIARPAMSGIPVLPPTGPSRDTSQ
ncbi:hypothetical protein ABIA32_002167 [Streptacidiphilus sp. MAP12-20]|uniref:DUF6113 family protein n=1 Tax=Streptacidiphilus sp. MAP12-20 TaxID=3156299 RepID=UPI0035126F66